VTAIVTFKWQPKPGYRSTFTFEHVNTSRRMLLRHYQTPHRFVCVTDDPSGLDPEVEVIPLWDDYAHVPNPTWKDGPSCYRRLKVFSKWFGRLIGERFYCMDLDKVITHDITALLDRPEPFVAMRSHIPAIPLCGSFFGMDPGSQSFVWDSFHPERSPALATKKGCRGSDQGWMAYCYGNRFPSWGQNDGVYSYMQLVPRNPRHRPVSAFQWPKEPRRLPVNAKIVFFTGKPDPWDEEALKVSPWIREHYR
jgi:hypothetical protein